jgi:hypothetical protein
MAVSQQEAKDLLRDISTTQQRSSNAYGYGKASPHLILWGVIWVLGYGGAYYLPHMPYLFTVLSIGGIIGSSIIGFTMKSGTATSMDWRYWATLITIFLFITAIFAIMPPTKGEQIGAFFPILVALFYALTGIWTRGVRMIVLGAAVAALTVVGYFFLLPYFAIWMALVGGGGLILGGFWLRTL